jgi:hypothetical protein
VILELKKRNYLNIVYIDISFKQRYQYFLTETARADTLEAMREFMTIDEEAQN